MGLQPHALWTEIGLRLLAYGRRTLLNPQWLVMAVLGRFVVMRRWISLMRRSSPDLALQPLERSLFCEINIDHTVDCLHRYGLYAGLNLPPSCLEKLLQAIPDDRTCKTDYSYGAQYATSANLVLRNPLLQNILHEISQDPVLIALARGYLGTPPVYSGSKVWWSFAVNKQPLKARQPVHCFHYDLYDYQCLRFFFYLTDVNESCGPHQFVQGSHHQRRLRHALSPLKACTDSEIVEYYGSENVITITGPAGTGFAEDPFCFHKGTPPQLTDRLILMLQFVAHDYGVFNHLNHPFAFYRPN